jgi:Tfp pilus assembly protein PilF
MFLILTATGCQWHKQDHPAIYRTLALDPNRDTDAARRHNANAIQFLKDSQPELAEAEFKAALAADLFFGPAHNNLGTLYYEQRKYYLAAWEFQYAVKLMPNSAEAKNNLGLVFEAVGKLDKAAEWYDKALALEPDSVEVIGNLARTYVRDKRNDARTRQLLDELVLKDTRPEWVAWAKDRLALMGTPEPPTTQPAFTD